MLHSPGRYESARLETIIVALLIPEGQLNLQKLVIYRKSPRGEIRRKEGEDVAFVPLLGRHGWKTQK